MIADLVSFDTTGLVLQPSSPEERHWATERGLTVVATAGKHTPVFPATAAGEAAMRAEYRKVFANAGAGLVEMMYPRVDSCQAVRTIVKVVMDPTTGWGRRFIGHLEIATANACLVLRAECSESGPTGFRETAVVKRLLESGALTFPERPPGESSWLGPGDMKGWMLDPHDPTPAHLAYNASDERQYDADFPDHPLSLVRSFLDRAQSSMSLAPKLKGERSEDSTAKRWWNLW